MVNPIHIPKHPSEAINQNARILCGYAIRARVCDQGLCDCHPVNRFLLLLIPTCNGSRSNCSFDIFVRAFERQGSPSTTCGKRSYPLVERSNSTINEVSFTNRTVDCCSNSSQSTPTSLLVGSKCADLKPCTARIMRVLAFGSARSKRRALYRTVFLLGCVATGWLLVWLVLPRPNPRVEKSDPHLTSPSSSPLRRPTFTRNLGDILFPAPSTSESSPWVRKNHLTLQSLFRCIEHFDCHANQTKGAYFSPPLFIGFGADS
jgi:hypothetical protein